MLSDKQKELLEFFGSFDGRWVELKLAREAGVLITSEDQTELDWLIHWKLLQLYDITRPYYAVRLNPNKP
jgi:hypothetical protein